MQLDIPNPNPPFTFNPPAAPNAGGPTTVDEVTAEDPRSDALIPYGKY